MVVVFDFDKTLTYNDTLFGFYKITNKPNFSYYVKRVLLIVSAICYKLKIINNDRLKKIGISLFLKGKDKQYIDQKAKIYASSIKLNEIYKNDFLKYSNEDRIIVSASFIEYLKPLFPNDDIICSTLKYSPSDKVINLHENVYAEQKRVALENQGIVHIDILYTDSYSDKALMNISNKTFLIKNGIKSVLNNEK